MDWEIYQDATSLGYCVCKTFAVHHKAAIFPMLDSTLISIFYISTNRAEEEH